MERCRIPTCPFGFKKKVPLVVTGEMFWSVIVLTTTAFVYEPEKGCGEVCDWMHGAGRVQTKCEFSLRAGMRPSDQKPGPGPAIKVRVKSTHEFLIEPHSASSLDLPVVCEHEGEAEGPVVLLIASGWDYLFRLWPYVVNKVAWAKSVNMRLAIWIGAVPPNVARTIGAECVASREERKKSHRRLKTSIYVRKYGELNSNHHSKMLASLALLHDASVDGVFYVDLDAVVPAKMFGDKAKVSSLLRIHFDNKVDVLFENSRVPAIFWHVKASMFYVRDSTLGRRFMAAWLHWRCGFKDQYSVWHTILALARSYDCIDYHDEIFRNFTYKEAQHSGSHVVPESFPYLVLSCPDRMEKCPDFRFCDDEYDLANIIFDHNTIPHGDGRDYTYKDVAGKLHKFTVQDYLAESRSSDYLRDEPGRDLLEKLSIDYRHASDFI